MTERLGATARGPIPCRLLIDPPAPGPWNMAVDEVLFASASRSGRPCWRFYRWDQPTLSLGYFQTYPNLQEHPAMRQCPVVRRLTGGGAILHDQELTYSLVLPTTHPMARQRLLLYQTVHASLVDALRDYGVTASVVTPSQRPRVPNSPFLCFQRRSPGDVVVGGAKIAGSAQRRSASAVLQHGSVLLHRCPVTPEIPALEDAAGTAVAGTDLIPAWLHQLATRLQLRWCPESLSDAEKAQAQHLVESQYASHLWTRYRKRCPRQ